VGIDRETLQPEVEEMTGRPRRRMVAAAVLALSIAACTGDPDLAGSTTAPVSARPAERVSQSAADAKRDGVFPPVAELPFAQRVDTISTVRIDDDTWSISRLPARGAERVGCSSPRKDRVYGRDYVCGSEYGELLQVDGKRIVRAYPLPSVPPQHIAITEDAVYCARQGDGGLSTSMVCRVDRRTNELVVRLFPSATEPGSFVSGDLIPPDTWEIDDEELEVNKFAVDDGGVWAKAYKAGWTRLDPDTLEIVERDIERVTTEP
jgi:hypothetical protein